MFNKALIKAYVDNYGYKAVCREEFCQLNPKGFLAIKAVFGSYAEFLQEVMTSKVEKDVPTKVKK